MNVKELSVLMKVCGHLLLKDQEEVTLSEAIGLLTASPDAVALAIRRMTETLKEREEK